MDSIEQKAHAAKPIGIPLAEDKPSRPNIHYKYFHSTTNSMSLPQLASTTDCGPGNPMANLVKQFHLDRSLQQDRTFEQRGESSKVK
ncbi:hypothetical protein BX666DRAFT_1010198 [Dichotomocladium elegans]|nr:hypothetical protein BX666DRAFT_1010198 [Dichotomocladium elegans]